MAKANLSEAKTALLQKWLGGHLNDTVTTIPKRLLNNSLSLSFPQQRQLFLEMLQPGTAVNNLSALLDIRGRLDIAALEISVNEIIARHDSLRTCFSFNEGLPKPKIVNDIKINISVVDLRQSTGEALETKARQLAEKDVVQPFNLVEAPLLRLKLYALGQEHHWLLLTIHHIVCTEQGGRDGRE